MADYDGVALVLDERGNELETVRAELWSVASGNELIWGGDLYPTHERFRSGLEGCRGQTFTLRLPTGHSANCEIEKVRAILPQLIRIDGIGPAPFA